MHNKLCGGPLGGAYSVPRPLHTLKMCGPHEDKKSEGKRKRKWNEKRREIGKEEKPGKIMKKGNKRQGKRVGTRRKKGKETEE